MLAFRIEIAIFWQSRFDVQLWSITSDKSWLPPIRFFGLTEKGMREFPRVLRRPVKWAAASAGSVSLNRTRSDELENDVAFSVMDSTDLSIRICYRVPNGGTGVRTDIE